MAPQRSGRLCKPLLQKVRVAGVALSGRASMPPVLLHSLMKPFLTRNHECNRLRGPYFLAGVRTSSSSLHLLTRNPTIESPKGPVFCSLGSGTWEALQGTPLVGGPPMVFRGRQVAAWRFGIDPKGRGQLNFNEFCTAVRRCSPQT